MNIYLRKAYQNEAEKVFAMVTDRVRWMNENDIHQWNDTDYLTFYPLNYYQTNLSHLYVLVEKCSEKILCAANIFEKDDRWNSDESAYYIHNFVSTLDSCSRGSGIIFIQKLEEIAAQQGIKWLRLDSAVENRILSEYYEKIGFRSCGECYEGKYHGILWQKKI